jgi:tetratricopeptide (TPR) repeat protein
MRRHLAPHWAPRAAFACLAFAACLPAATQDPWLKITSANFELYTTAGERAGRDLIRHFEQVRSFFLQAFGSRLPASRPARIIAFRNEKEYQPYRPNEFATAFFQPGAAHDFIVMSSASSDHYAVAVHEYTHLMIHQSGMEIPPWLNEGLAELYSSLEPRGTKMLVGQVIPGRLQVLRSEPWIPLAALLAAEHGSPYYNEKSRAGMFYAESWALVHMLNLDPAYRPQLKSLVAALKENDPAAAFLKAYGKQTGEVEAALRTYFNGSTVRAQLFDVQIPKSVDAPEIQPTASLPARLALAELLGNYRGRGEQAGAAYEQLAKDYPDRWEVAEGWGQFAWQQRKLADAARHFARAMELGCRNLPSLLVYARVLGYNNQPKEEAAVLLKTAGLFPESDEVNLELGATLVRNGNFGAAAAALLAVKKVGTAEEAYRLFYNLAYAQYRLGDAPHARENNAKARNNTRNPAEMAAIDRLQQALDRPPVRADGAVQPPDDDAADVPRLQRRKPGNEAGNEPGNEPAEAPALPQLPSVEGMLEDMECGTLARLHVRVEGEVEIFVIPDPSKVAIHGTNGETIELQCGPQKPPRALRIAYQALPASPRPTSMAGVAGVVRTLEFR